MSNYGNITLIGLTSALLIACGGGGGSSSGGGGGGTAAAQIALNESNAAEVSGTVSDAALNADELTAGNTLLGVVTSGDNNFDLSEFAAEQISRITLMQSSAISDGVTGVVIEEQTIACGAMGTVTFSGDIADPAFNGVSNGDQLNLRFNNCDEGDGVILNGGFNMVLGAVEGDLLFGTPPYSFAVDVDIDNLSIAIMGDTFTANGDMSVSVSTEDNVNFSTQLSGNSLDFTQGGQLSTLSNYDITEEFNQSNGAYSISVNGTFTNTDLGGQVTFSTLVTFQGFWGDLPTSGEMLITGADNSSINLIADGIDNVTLLVDSNGDGETDETIVSSWMELTSL